MSKKNATQAKAAAKETVMENPTFRLVDFKVKNEKCQGKKGRDNKKFMIEMFGMNEKGETCAIWVEDFKPFFYIKVGDGWGKSKKTAFVDYIKQQLRIQSLKSKYKSWKKNQQVWPEVKEDESEIEYITRAKENFTSYYEDSIVNAVILESHKLYGFDNNKLHRFICLQFKNTTALNKVKNFWYDITIDKNSIFGRKYKLKTFNFMGENTELYEAKLPPLLRYFHIKQINPSGWIEIPLDKVKNRSEKTYCKHEYTIKFDDIIPLPHKEDAVPLIIASFDIEASSSHGDFPVAKKTYRKLAGDIITYWNKNKSAIRKMGKSTQETLLVRLIKTAFGFQHVEDIDVVYPKKRITERNLDNYIAIIFVKDLKQIIDEKRARERREEVQLEEELEAEATEEEN